jgi:hypothetical protein
VALEALRVELTVAQLVSKHSVHQTLVKISLPGSRPFSSIARRRRSPARSHDRIFGHWYIGGVFHADLRVEKNALSARCRKLDSLHRKYALRES